MSDSIEITEEFVEKCIMALIKYPGSISKAAGDVGISDYILRRAYNVGWKSYNVPPLRELVAIKTAELRANAFHNKTTALAIAEKEGVIAEAIDFELKEMVDNLEVVYKTRQTAAAINNVASTLLMKAEEVITNGLNMDDFADLPVNEQLKILKSITDISKQATSVSDNAIKLHKLVLGESISTISHKHKVENSRKQSDMSDEEMSIIISTARAAISAPNNDEDIIDADIDED